MSETTVNSPNVLLGLTQVLMEIFPSLHPAGGGLLGPGANLCFNTAHRTKRAQFSLFNPFTCETLNYLGTALMND